MCPGVLFWVVTWVNWYIGISLLSLCFLYLFFAVVYSFLVLFYVWFKLKSGYVEG